MVDPVPAEAAEQAGFVLDMFAIGALNLAACLVVLFLGWQVTWWGVVGLQMALFLAALVEGIRTDGPGWISFSSLPLLTLFLLVALRLVHTRLVLPAGEIAI